MRILQISRIFLPVLFVLFLSNFSFGFDDYSVKPIRKLNICILIYKEANQVSKKTVKSLIQKASEDYENNVGIKFKIVEKHETSLDVIKSWDLRKEFRSECVKGDAVIVFTNKEQPGNWGRSNSDFNVIWIYEVDSLLNANQCFTTQMTVEHEIAHLFGVWDELGNRSFMHTDYKCTRMWPSEIKDVIFKNKFKIFSYPR